MTVYISQEMRGRDISNAFEYGEVEILVPAKIPIYEVRGPINRVSKAVEKKLTNFSPLKDYLLLAGDPIAIGIACAYVSDITGGFFRVLKWDRLENRYHPVLIDLYGEYNE